MNCLQNHSTISKVQNVQVSFSLSKDTEYLKKVHNDI